MSTVHKVAHVALEGFGYNGGAACYQLISAISEANTDPNVYWEPIDDWPAITTVCNFKKSVTADGGETWTVDGEYSPAITTFDSEGTGGGSSSPDVAALQASVANLQSQLTSMQGVSGVDAAGVADRLLDQSSLWGLFLGAAIVILCIKGLYNVFNRAPSSE